MSNRTCKRCQVELSLKEFEKRKTTAGNEYTRAVCKTCHMDKMNKARSADPKYYLKNLHSQLKYSRKKEGIKWTLTVDQVSSLWDLQEGRCATTDLYMTWHKGGDKRDLNVSLDRINPQGPYTIVNVQLVCHRVNLIKHTMPEDELYWWCKNIVTNKEKY